MASTKTTAPCTSSVSVGVGTEETYREMGGYWERTDHPLLNDVILSHLFEFVRSKDLKVCRLVCKKWCVLTLPSARSKFSVKLHGRGEEMTRKLTDFVVVFRENKPGIPFVQYNLDPFCTTEGPGQEFLQIIGSTAKRVSLTGQGHHELTQFTVEVEDISELLKAMPKIEYFGVSYPTSSQSGNFIKLFPDNGSTKPTLSFLKKLRVSDWDLGDRDKTSECCLTFIEEIFSIATNISDVAVQDYRNNPGRNRIGQVLDAIEKLKVESVIRNLTLNGAYPEHVEYLGRLAENGLKLKNLDFWLARGYLKRNQEDQIKYLPQLARIFKNSLEDLEVDEVCPSFSQLPHMPRLEKLEFKVPWNFDSKNVNLNKLLPALKELVLYSLDLDWEWEELLPNSEPCPNLKALSFDEIVGNQMFDHILNIFPNLTKLELTVQLDSVEILNKIMSQMTQLENLSVWGTIEGIESIDAFFAGIPVQSVPKLEDVASELKEMTVQLRADTIRHYRDRYCNSPSIANLTNLRRLHLSITGRGDNRENEPTRESRMTDVFAYFCLYSMTHINKLDIGDCEFTESSCKILTDEMELEAWAFQDKNDDNIIPEVR